MASACVMWHVSYRSKQHKSFGCAHACFVCTPVLLTFAKLCQTSSAKYVEYIPRSTHMLVTGPFMVLNTSAHRRLIRPPAKHNNKRSILLFRSSSLATAWYRYRYVNKLMCRYGRVLGAMLSLHGWRKRSIGGGR